LIGAFINAVGKAAPAGAVVMAQFLLLRRGGLSGNRSCRQQGPMELHLLVTLAGAETQPALFCYIISCRASPPAAPV